jgi:hypothetical protein
MIKVFLLLRRRPDLTREEFLQRVFREKCG